MGDFFTYLLLTVLIFGGAGLAITLKGYKPGDPQRKYKLNSTKKKE